MNRALFPNRLASFMRGIALIAAFFFLPVSVSAQTYDDYLLATQKVGETIASGITAGVENTAQLYRSVWSEVTSLTQQGPTLKLPLKHLPTEMFGRPRLELGLAKVGPAIASYTQFSNSLGKTFTQTLIAGTGASQEFSQKVWSTDPYGTYASFTQDTGALIAQGIKNGVKGSADIYAQSFTKTKQLVQKTPDLKLAINTDGAANISDIWNSTTNYFSNLWNDLTEPRPRLKTAPQGQTLTPTTTKAATPQAKVRPSPTQKPVATPKQPAPNETTPLPRSPLKAPQGEALEVPVITTRILSGVTSADLELKIQQLRNELVSKIGQVAGQTQSNYTNNFQAIALTNKIDQLTNTVITTPTITGGSITNTSISGGTISGTTISGTTLTVSSGIFSGNLTVSGTATSTFAGDSAFDTNTLYIDSLNNRVGIATSSPSDTFAVAGPIYIANSSPSPTANRLYGSSGSLYWAGSLIGGATTGTWDTDGTHVWRPTGNVGLGTTSPYAKLSVVGETVSSYFTATTTTASTFPYASSTALTVSGSLFTPLTSNSVPFIGTSGLLTQNTSQFVWDNTNFRLGLGTTSPYAKLSVVGETVSSYFTATSTTKSTFPYASTTALTVSGNSYLGTVSGGTWNGTAISAAYGGTGLTSWTPGDVLYAGGATTLAGTSTANLKTTLALNLVENTALSTWAGSTNLTTLGTITSGIWNAGALTSSGALTINGAGNSYIAGNLGIGTTSPYAKLTVWGSGTGTNQLVNFANSASTTLWTLLENGNVGIGTTSPYTKLSVVGEVAAQYFTATSTTATTTISGGLNVGNGAILYDYSSGVASVGNLELGSLSFDTNAGTVNWMDMPVTSSATAGTVESYSAQLDGTALITAYSQSDGAGNIKLSAVGIGTTTPTARLTVTTATTTENIPLFTVASSTGATLFTILNSGYVGIGTTTSAVNNTLVVQGGVCITGGTTCPTVSSGSLRVDTAGVAGADDPGDVFDVAERYPAKEVMSAGEIAALDTDTEDAAVIKKGTQGDVLLGIVSTRAAVAINGNDLTLAPAGEATSTKPLIALAGRVPVKVTMEGGVIKKGDRITASSVAGVGMKATSTAQQTVGIALEGFSGTDEGAILVFVQTSTSRLDPAISQGTILDGNGESSFWSVEEGSGRIKFISQGIDLNDQDIVSVRAIIGSAGKWSIDASGRLVVNEVQTNKLCVGDTCVTQDEFKKVFGGSQAAQVSTTPLPTPVEGGVGTPTDSVGALEPTPSTAPSSTPQTNLEASPPSEEPALEPTPEPQPEPAPEPPAESALEPQPEPAPESLLSSEPAS